MTIGWGVKNVKEWEPFDGQMFGIWNVEGEDPRPYMLYWSEEDARRDLDRRRALQEDDDDYLTEYHQVFPCSVAGAWWNCIDPNPRQNNPLTPIEIAEIHDPSRDCNEERAVTEVVDRYVVLKDVRDGLGGLPSSQELWLRWPGIDDRALKIHEGTSLDKTTEMVRAILADLAREAMARVEREPIVDRETAERLARWVVDAFDAFDARIQRDPESCPKCQRGWRDHSVSGNLEVVCPSAETPA